MSSDARLRELDFAACVLGHFRWLACVIALVCVIDEQKLYVANIVYVSRTIQLLLNNIDTESLIT